MSNRNTTKGQVTETSESEQVTATTGALDAAIMASEPATVEVTSLGGGIEVLSDRRVRLTPKFISAFLALKEFANERKLTSKWVAHLRRTMKQGTFRPEIVTLVSAFCAERRSDGEFRMNGQHCVWAVSELYQLDPNVDTVEVRHIRYQCKTDYDLRQLYASIDRGKSRTSTHVALSYLGDTPELAGFRDGIVRYLVGGLGMFLWEGEQGRRRDMDERCYLLLSEYLDLGRKVGQFMKAHGGRDEYRFYRIGVVGAMFATFNRAVSDSKEFWEAVVTGINLTRSSPMLKLRNFLVRISSTTIPMSERLRATDENIYRACLLAWNAYRDDRTLEQLKPTMTTSRPVVK